MKKPNNIFIIITILVVICMIIGIITIMVRTNNLGTQYVKKPIIYIYPEETINVNVTLGKPNKISCSYPEYIDGWNVIANPNGDLIDISTNNKLYALYWEGADLSSTISSDGFIVKGEDTISFLEEKLEYLGLNYKERNEFIIYWLPKLENNKYNYIRFKTIDEINDYMPLSVYPEPDTIIRVYMEYKSLEDINKINIEEQVLIPVIREGYTVVEWGGSEIK